MKLIDKKTNEVIADVMTNHSMSIDEVLELMRYGVNEEGQIIDSDNGVELNAWYDDLEMTY